MPSEYIEDCNCSACEAVRAVRAAKDAPINPVNAQALTDIIPVLRELDAQDRFDMRAWANGVVNPNAADYTECGTQFCLAGAKAVLDGWRPQYQAMKRFDYKLGGYVPVPNAAVLATGKFVRPENRHITDEDSPLAHLASAIAAEAFALDRGQMEFLFHCTHVSRVTDLVRRIQWLIDGESPRTYPQALITLERAHEAEDRNKRNEAHDKALQPAAAE